MCPHSRICAIFMAGIIATKIVTCSFKEECPYTKEESDEPMKNILIENLFKDAIVVASGSGLFNNSGIGSFIKDLPNGEKLFFVKPDITIMEGKITLIKGGEELTINFERNKQDGKERRAGTEN